MLVAVFFLMACGPRVEERAADLTSVLTSGAASVSRDPSSGQGWGNKGSPGLVHAIFFGSTAEQIVAQASTEIRRVGWGTTTFGPPEGSALNFAEAALARPVPAGSVSADLTLEGRVRGHIVIAPGSAEGTTEMHFVVPIN